MPQPDRQKNINRMHPPADEFPDTLPTHLSLFPELVPILWPRRYFTLQLIFIVRDLLNNLLHRLRIKVNYNLKILKPEISQSRNHSRPDHVRQLRHHQDGVIHPIELERDPRLPRLNQIAKHAVFLDTDRFIHFDQRHPRWIEEPVYMLIMILVSH